MALELAAYRAARRVIVHRARCRVWTTVPRARLVEPVVVVDEGWAVEPCGSCRPVFAVVARERFRVLSRSSEMVRRFEAREERRRLRPDDVDVPPASRVRDGWRAEAACRSGDDRLGGWLSWLFTAETGARWQTDMQKVVCGACPVRADCLVEAVRREEPFGVWGGATPAERRLLAARWRTEGRLPAAAHRPRRAGSGTLGDRDLFVSAG